MFYALYRLLFSRSLVSQVNEIAYRCSWSNGVFEPSQINWAIPDFSYQQILERIERRTR